MKDITFINPKLKVYTGFIWHRIRSDVGLIMNTVINFQVTSLQGIS